MSAKGADAVRRALDLLGRASADWRNGGQSPEGPLHWPVAVSLARREFRQALEIIEGAHPATATPARCGHCGGSGSDDDNPCPHCGGTGFEGDEPCEFCDATGRDGDHAEIYAACRTSAGFEGVLDVRTAIWRYNSWSRAERAYWHRIAGSAVPADAYRAYCEGVYEPQP